MRNKQLESLGFEALSERKISLWDYCRLKAKDFYIDDRTYLKDMCDKLLKFIESDKKILVINLPPRHGKSRTATLLVQWLLGNDNKIKVMTGSYNETLSTTFAKQVRDSILEQDGIFSKLYPKTNLLPSYLQIPKLIVNACICTSSISTPNNLPVVSK